MEEQAPCHRCPVPSCRGSADLVTAIIFVGGVWS